jgi:hypothetical protein
MPFTLLALQSELNASIMNKLVMMRCANSAVLIFSLTAWQDTFSPQNAQQVGRAIGGGIFITCLTYYSLTTALQVMNVLLANCFSSPIFRFINPIVWVDELIKAPIARDQVRCSGS